MEYELSLCKELCSGSKKPEECLRIASILNNNLTTENLAPSTLDGYLNELLNETTGLLVFVQQNHADKLYEKAIKKCLEILYTVIDNFPKKLEKHVFKINEVCLNVYQGNSGSSEKTAALQVILLILNKIEVHLENQRDYLRIFEVVMARLKLDSGVYVRRLEYQILGAICQYISFIVSEEQVAIRNILVQGLQTEGRTSQLTSAALFEALTKYCSVFGQNLLTEQKTFLYGLIKELGTETTFKIHNRAALIFFAHNLNMFSEGLSKDYLGWHTIFLKVLSNDNADNKKAGLLCLKLYFKYFSEILLDQPKGPMHQHFIKYFSIKISKKNSDSLLQQTVLQGLSFFAKTFVKCLPEEEFSSLQAILLENLQDCEELDSLSYYIETMSPVLSVKPMVHLNEIYLLEASVVKLIQFFPELPFLQRTPAINSIILCLDSLRNCSFFEQFVDVIIFQGTIRACSNYHVTDSEAELTVKSYLPLWFSLLKIRSNFSQIGIDYKIASKLESILVSKMIKTLLVLLKQLDISLIKKNCPAMDLANRYEVGKADDYGIFLNLVDFYEAILTKLTGFQLKDYLGKFVEKLINLCEQNPFVSGFFKLLTSFLKLFKEVPEEKINHKKLLGFYENTIKTLNHFKNELLVARLKVILETPENLLADLLPKCVEAFKMFFQQDVALAQLALNVLFEWQKIEQIKTIFEQFVVQIVGCLDKFLLSKASGSSTAENQSIKKTKADIKKRVVNLELEPELIKLQKDILKFIGGQSNKVCETFAQHQFEETFLHKTNHLKVSLPFEGLQVEFIFDGFLTRLVELSLHSSDQKTRLTACELLHSLVMVFFGRNKLFFSSFKADWLKNQSALKELDPLWSFLAKPLLSLACDNNFVIKQIFEPLFLQIVHWFTFATQQKSTHSAILIETLMEGITHESDSNLRDFAGLATKELVKWSLRTTHESYFANIKVLVKKMRFFSNHSDQNKKLGAALIFNNIYVELREERNIISVFWLEIIHIFITSLEEINSDNQLIIEATFEALNHLVRVLIERKSIFLTNSESNNRRVPAELKDGTLNDLAWFLLEKTTSKNSLARLKSCELFVTVASLISSNPNDFLSEKFGVKSYWTSEYYDNNMLKITEVPEDSSEWLNLLERSLDGYSFVIKNSLLGTELKLDFGLIISLKLFLSKKMYLENSLLTVKMLQFLNAILHDEFHKRNHILFDHLIWEFLAFVIFYFEGNTNELLQTVLTRLNNENLTSSLVAVLVKKIEENYVEETTNTRYINGLILLQNSSLNSKLKVELTIFARCSSIVNDSTVWQQPQFGAVWLHYNKLLQVVLYNDDEFKKMLPYLFEPDGLKLFRFSKTISTCICKNFELFLQETISKQNYSLLERFLEELNDKPRDFLQFEPEISRLFEDFFPELLSNSFASNIIQLEFALKIVKLLVGFTRKNDYKNIIDWLFSIFNTNFMVNIYANTFELLVTLVKDYRGDVMENALQKLESKISENTLDKFVKKALVLLPKIQNELLLEFLIKLYLKSSNNQDFIKIPCQAIRTIYRLNYNEKFSKEQKFKLIPILTPQLQACNLDFARQFLNEISSKNDLTNPINLAVIEVLFPRLNLDQKQASPYLRACLDTVKLAGQDEFTRKIRCQAYKTTASIVCALKLESFYSKLFARFDEGNKDVLWENLIDISEEVKFGSDFESLPKARKIVVNIRKELHEERAKFEDKTSINYLQSQRIQLSSLSVDVGRFDFNASVVRSSEPSGDMEQKEVFLDQTDYNLHEVMPTLCGVVQTLLQDHKNQETTPNWLQNIQTILLNRSTSKNVKIFLVKMIDNCSEHLEPFSKHLVEPLVRFLVDKNAGNSLNYFISDILFILARWAKTYIPRADLINELFGFLFEQLNNERHDIFKYNLELIKLLVEAWSSKMSFPTSLIQRKLMVDENNRLILSGISLLSICLANKLPIDSIFVDFIQKTLLKCLHSKTRGIYRRASETIGLLLAYNNYLVPQVNAELLKLDRSKYIDCLEGITIFCIEILDYEHLSKIQFNFHSAANPLKVIYLKLILRYSNSTTLDNYLKEISWSKHLETDSLEVVLLVLEVLFYWENSQSQATLALPILEKLTHHSNVLIRNRVFDIAIKWFNENLQARDLVLQGLSDSENEIQMKIRAFLETQLQVNLPERLIGCLNFYCSKNEASFLGAVSYLLLENLMSSNCNTSLFEYPLEDCTFEEYQLQVNWRKLNRSVVPLFADTIGYTESATSFTKNWNEIKATPLNLSFAPTQYTQSESTLFVNPNNVEISQDYRRKDNRRRFLNDKTKISLNFANIQVKKKVEKHVKMVEKLQEQENKVVVYRTYKKGDFPDVQISLKAILKPLQVLSLYDSEIAKIFCCNLMQVLFNCEFKEEFYLPLYEAIKKIFNNSQQFNTNLFRTLFDVVLINKKLPPFELDLISEISLESGLTSIGTLILEQYLKELDVEEPSHKIRVKPGNKIWLKLAELNKELENWDLVRIIYLNHLIENDLAVQAIEFEQKKNWNDAVENYSQLIDEEILPEYKDYFFESSLHCLARLGQWDHIPDLVSSFLDPSPAWNTLWTDKFLQNKVLPWVVQAETNLILLGEPRNNFLRNLNQSLLLAEQAQVLRTKFSENLLVLSLLQQSTFQDEIEDLSEKALQEVLFEWQATNPEFSRVRFKKIMRLRRIVSVLFQQQNSLLQEDEFTSILDAQQNFLLKSFICKKLSEDSKEIQQKLGLNFVNEAIRLNEYQIGKKFLRNCDSEDPKAKLAACSLAFLLQKRLDSPQRIQRIESSVEILNELCSSSSSVCLEASLKRFDFLCDLYSLTGQPTKLAEEAVHTLQGILQQNSCGKGYLKLANFVRKSSLDEYYPIFVLQALKLGEHTALPFLPLVFEYNGRFASLLIEVPTWMFLAWIPQLLACLNNPDKIKIFHDVILRIARTYPQSIVYAFELAKSYYKSQGLCPIALKVYEELELLLDPKVQQFLKALTYVCVPEIRLKYFVDELIRLIEKPKEFEVLKSSILEELKTRGRSHDPTSLKGSIFERVSSFKNDLKRPTLENLNKISQKLRPKSDGRVVLKDYSPWLNNFSSAFLDLEIPGQYTGKSPPQTRHHIRISSFDPTVSIISSLRCPIKISIVGDNGLSYPYLVKFGEDLRQDQRILQLFNLMNECLDSKITTYKVVPIFTYLGLVEWVEPTSTFKKLLFSDKEKTLDELTAKHSQFLLGKSSLSRDQVIPFYRGLSAQIPGDLLKNGLLTLSRNTEQFIRLRRNFLESYSTVCMGHWVLGIGDRHLSNFLVNLLTGRALGIDFGHAFGVATQFQAVPELVPFRLTPCITSLAEPFGLEYFRGIMTQVLGSLRDYSPVILAAMSVFVKEPSINWLGDKESWYPNEKIDHVTRKLNGASSVSIMIEEINGSKRINNKEALIGFVRGHEQFDKRFKLNRERLSVEEQVDCLLDHAEDPNLLGRMFPGWQSFV